MTLECIIQTTDSVEKFHENKSTLRIINKKNRKLSRRSVDGCLITTGIRCDYLLVDEITETEVYIELKGSDVEHAVDQICITSNQLSASPQIKWGYVICTRNPMNSTEVQIAQKKVAKSHNLRLRVKKTVHEVDIEDLIK
jgi:hypothetical protein